MRTLFKMILLVALIYGGWYLWQNYDLKTWYNDVKTAIENNDTKGALILPKKFGVKTEKFQIAIKDCVFYPQEKTIFPGQKLTWENQDNTIRQIIGDFESGVIAPGKRFSKTFNEIGNFFYYCADEPANKGVVIVKNL